MTKIGIIFIACGLLAFIISIRANFSKEKERERTFLIALVFSILLIVSGLIFVCQAQPEYASNGEYASLSYDEGHDDTEESLSPPENFVVYPLVRFEEGEPAADGIYYQLRDGRTCEFLVIAEEGQYRRNLIPKEWVDIQSEESNFRLIEYKVVIEGQDYKEPRYIAYIPEEDLGNVFP